MNREPRATEPNPTGCGSWPIIAAATWAAAAALIWATRWLGAHL